jgi:hypothetical protein
MAESFLLGHAFPNRRKSRLKEYDMISRFQTMVCVVVLMSLSFGHNFIVIAMQQSLSDEKKWLLLEEFPCPAWLVTNIPPKEKGIKIREIFIYIETPFFTQETIKTVVKKLALNFKAPENRPFEMLSITIFDDKEMIKRAAITSQTTICIYFADTPEGQKAEEEYYKENYPLKAGYFRAFYNRSFDGSQSLLFSFNFQSEKLTLLPLD